MANESQRVLELLIRLKADAAGGQQIRNELQAVQAQAAQTAAALNQTATRTIRDTSGLPAGQDRGDSAAAVALRAQLDAQVATRNALRGIAGQTLVLDQQSVIAAELSAAAEAKKVVQMERQVIMEIQLEAAEARIAGNPAMAVKLEREAAIRLQALTIQRATNVSMELALVQAERLILAQEAGNAKAAAGITFTRGQATALAQQLATGRVSAESISRTFSGLGSTLSIAGVAGYALYQVIASAADEAVRLAKEVEKETAALEKNVTLWFEMANAAGDFGDVIKIGESIQPQLDTLAAKLAEFRANELTLWQKFTDVLTRTFGSAIPGSGPNFNQENRDKAIAQLEQAEKTAFVAGNASVDAAEKAKAAWEAVNLLPLNEAVAEYTQKLNDLRAKQSGIDRNASVPDFNEWVKVNREIELTTKRLDGLTKTQTKLASESEKVADAIAKADFAQLDSTGQLDALQTNLLEIQDKLQQLGVDAASPNDALEKSKDLTAETREEVLKLAQAWATVLGEIAKVVEQQEEDRRKARADEVNASLLEQRTLIQGIHQQQQLIAANPYLSPDAKAALTLASLSAEILRMGAAIEQTKQQIADSALDPELHARLQAQLQKDQFEFDMLQLKIAAIDKPLAAELTEWVNSFGTSAQQIAGIIENSINASLQATNQLITDAVFNTGDWRQVIVGLEKQMLNFFLTWMEQQLLQFVFGEGLKQTATASSMAQGAALAGGYAPAAAASSVATSGTSAIIGQVLAIAAIAAIVAALTGGFKRGGYTGEGSADEYAGPAHKGEFYFNKRATENIGLSRLYAMHHAAEHAPHFFEGGEVEPGILPGNIGRPPYFNPMYSPRPWQSPYPYRGDYAVSPRLFPGGGNNPFAPGGPYHSFFSPYNPSAGGVGGGRGNPFAPGGRFYSRFLPDGTPNPYYSGEWNGPNNQGTGPRTGPYPWEGQAPFFSGGYNSMPNPRGQGFVPNLGGAQGSFTGPPSLYPTSWSYEPGLGWVPRAQAVGGGGGGGGGGSGGGFGRGNFGDASPRGSGQGPRLLTPGQYYRQTFGGLRGTGYRDTRGSAIGSLSGHSAMTMWFQSMGGTSIPMSRGRGDGNERFYDGNYVRDADGGYTRVGDLFGIGTSYNPISDPRIGSIIASNIPRRAVGGLLPGPPSTTDTMLAWLAGNEFVISSPAVEHAKQILGPNFLDDLNDRRIAIDRPHFASGGQVGGSSSRASSSAGGGKMKLVIVTDLKSAIREAQRDSDYATTIVNAVNGARHELGLPPIN